jgi:hypothetical protein
MNVFIQPQDSKNDQIIILQYIAAHKESNVEKMELPEEDQTRFLTVGFK